MKLLFAPILLLAAPLASPQEEQNAPKGVPALVKTLKEMRDNAEVDLIKQLANERTREAMEGLLEVYEAMQSVYMRRAVCQGLALYDDVPGAEHAALEKLMNVATEAASRELRESAVDLLGGCDDHGHAFLKMIVDSSAEDDVRERAMHYHVANTRPEDRDWYRAIYAPDAAEKAKKAAKKGGAEGQVPYRLSQVRLLAFEALAPGMEIEEIVAAAADRDQKIRAAALDELESRDAQKALAVAEDLWDKTTEPVRTRLVAARILMKAEGARVAADFIKEATKSAAPRELAFGLGDLLVELNDDGTNKKLLKSVGKGRGTEKLFYLRTTAHLEDSRLGKTLIKLLKDKELEVQRAAAEILGERREKEALQDLEGLIEKKSNPTVMTAALGAITQIRTNDAEWEERLLGYCDDAEIGIRNAALEAVGRTRNPDYLPVLSAALDHEQWSTRLAAARALAAMRLAEAVGPLCERIGKETGRMALEMSEILFRLTGKTFGTNGRQWSEWWKNEGQTFKLVSDSDLRKIQQEEEARRLKQVSRTEFFGIRIESHRVIFILDVSGSMNDLTRGQYLGDTGEPRISVAKRELLKAVDGLDLNSFFNIITFSSDVNPWRERISEKTTATFEDAKGFIERLGAGGGTNLYGSLELAFSDPDVDTIYVLSDGEPTVGAIIDGMAIREQIAAWNEHRNVVIHSIAVGGSFQILEWLAEDTGGTYVKFP